MLTGHRRVAATAYSVDTDDQACTLNGGMPQGCPATLDPLVATFWATSKRKDTSGIVVVLDAALLRETLRDAYMDLSTTSGRRNANIEAGSEADVLARRTLEVLLHSAKVGDGAVLGFIDTAKLPQTRDTRHIDSMHSVLKPEGLALLADRVDDMLARSTQLQPQQQQQQQRQQQQQQQQQQLGGAEGEAGWRQYLLVTDASLQAPAEGVDDEYRRLCEENGAEPQFDFVSAAFDAMDVSERAQLESAMTRPDGALVWLRIRGKWLLSRLTGNWTSAEATVLHVKGQAVQPKTLQLLSSREIGRASCRDRV